MNATACAHVWKRMLIVVAYRKVWTSLKLFCIVLLGHQTLLFNLTKLHGFSCVRTRGWTFTQHSSETAGNSMAPLVEMQRKFKYVQLRAACGPRPGAKEEHYPTIKHQICNYLYTRIDNDRNNHGRSNCRALGT